MVATADFVNSQPSDCSPHLLGFVEETLSNHDLAERLLSSPPVKDGCSPKPSACFAVG
jgi:hypothetical protein